MQSVSLFCFLLCSNKFCETKAKHEQTKDHETIMRELNTALGIYVNNGVKITKQKITNNA